MAANCDPLYWLRICRWTPLARASRIYGSRHRSYTLTVQQKVLEQRTSGVLKREGRALLKRKTSAWACGSPDRLSHFSSATSLDPYRFPLAGAIELAQVRSSCRVVRAKPEPLGIQDPPSLALHLMLNTRSPLTCIRSIGPSRWKLLPPLPFLQSLPRQPIPSFNRRGSGPEIALSRAGL